MNFAVLNKKGVQILTSIDEIQLLLDDHIIKSLTMLGSPFIKPLETEMREWSTRLQMIQDILDEWLKVRLSTVGHHLID